MSAVRYLAVLVGVIVTSCYIFPFVLAALPIANSKMIMAAIGIVLYSMQIFRNRDSGNVGKSFVQLTMLAVAVSLISLIAVVVNSTRDFTFATYFVSMWVWIGGGFTVVHYIRLVHGKASVSLLANYLLAVCVMQCVLAMVFDSSESAFDWRVRTFTGEAYMGATDEDRLSGIGCALDVAGLRFASVLIMTAFLAVMAARRENFRLLFFYIISFAFVTVIGNMISRTTVVGAGIAIVYVVVSIVAGGGKTGNRRLAQTVVSLTCVTVICSAILYNKNENFRENIRFGFEGFFSIVEKGEWETNSNNILKNMVVWPDNPKTWIIGDGYIENPNDKSLDSYDPYYVGPSFAGYYMQTDIGYCRYIFYFGVTGLLLFSFFFIIVAAMIAGRFPKFKWMFYLILLMNFIGWCKVSSDLFMVFAPFLCISARDEEDAEAEENDLKICS